jgi:hypothetical protein
LPDDRRGFRHRSRSRRQACCRDDLQTPHWNPGGIWCRVPSAFPVQSSRAHGIGVAILLGDNAVFKLCVVRSTVRFRVSDRPAFCLAPPINGNDARVHEHGIPAADRGRGQVLSGRALVAIQATGRARSLAPSPRCGHAARAARHGRRLLLFGLADVASPCSYRVNGAGAGPARPSVGTRYSRHENAFRRVCPGPALRSGDPG